MRLADFIEQQLPAIVSEWEAFAGTLLREGTMTPLVLRDHAEDMLRVIVEDLRTAQTSEHQHAKSWGREDAAHGASVLTAAQLHGSLRAASGISIQQLVSEFRAMRASVLRMYAQQAEAGAHTLQDIGRFNEAIDQAIAESAHIFQQRVEHWRNLFLGILQHDLRGPMQAVLSSASLIAALPAGEQREQATQRLRRSGERMRALLDELLDYNRATLNLGLRMNRVPCELAAACLEEVEMRRLAYPGHGIEWRAAGPTEGLWDASRIQQALGNLIANAARHGDEHAPIGVELLGTEDEVTIAVSNRGPAISPDAIGSIFDPLRSSADAGREDRSHLGLGLFVVKEVAMAHGGHVQVDSGDDLTRFCIRLPRRTPDAQT